MRIENDLIHEAAARQLNLDEYNQLLIVLSNTPKSNLVDSISPTDLVKILSFMDFENDDISDLAERIAKLIFPLFPIDFVQQSSEMLVTIFTDENYHLSLLIFKELNNVVTFFKNQGDIIIFSDEVIKRIVDIVFGKYLELSWTAQVLLINYCDQSTDICVNIFQKIMKPKFKHLLSDSVNIFRYIDVCIEIVLKSKHSELIDVTLSDDVVAVMNDIINSEDLLAHVNILDMLKKIAGDQMGYHLLVNKNILHNLYKRLPDISECPFSTILLPAYLSLFGQLYGMYPRDTANGYGDFLIILMGQFGCENISTRIHALEIFANFVSLPQCKLSLAKEYENVAWNAITSLVAALSCSDPEYQSRAANALALVFSAPSTAVTHEEVSLVNLKWCQMTKADETMMAFMNRVVVLPIESVKEAALSLALAISGQNWGQKLICGNGDLINILVIRSDQWKGCIDLKFELISNLVAGINQCTGGVSVCPEMVAAKLRQYHGEGKYYAVFEHEMMVDTDV